MLIRSTHEKLALMLAQKDERIEEMQNQAIARERSFKAAEVTHARELAELQKRLGEAHANQVAELSSSLQEQQRLKDEALKRVQELLEALAKQEDVLEEAVAAQEFQLQEANRRLKICERDSAAEIARLQAEIERLKALFDQERERRRDLEEKLRLAEAEIERLKRVKLVGIGIRITDEAPHRVTEIVEGGAASLSGALQVGDYILEVANMDASKHTIADLRSFILGPVGSYLNLKLDRRGEDDEPNVFTVNIMRAEITPTGPSLCDVHMKVKRTRTETEFRICRCPN